MTAQREVSEAAAESERPQLWGFPVWGLPVMEAELAGKDEFFTIHVDTDLEDNDGGNDPQDIKKRHFLDMPVPRQRRIEKDKKRKKARVIRAMSSYYRHSIGRIGALGDIEDNIAAHDVAYRQAKQIYQYLVRSYSNRAKPIEEMRKDNKAYRAVYQHAQQTREQLEISLESNWQMGFTGPEWFCSEGAGVDKGAKPGGLEIRTRDILSEDISLSRRRANWDPQWDPDRTGSEEELLRLMLDDAEGELEKLWGRWQQLQSALGQADLELAHVMDQGKKGKVVSHALC